MMSRVYCLRVSSTLRGCRSLFKRKIGEKTQVVRYAAERSSSFSSKDFVPRLQEQLKNVLALKSSNTGNWSTEKEARELCCTYLQAPQHQRHEFLEALAMQYTNRQRITGAAQEYLTVTEEKETMKCQHKLKQSLLPPYYGLFTVIGRLENGVKFLVDLRTDVLEILATTTTSDQRFAILQLNLVLQDLLMLWFSVGFLHLERITWASPCDLIEKISKYEAIHPMRNYLDLKVRLGAYRRCYIYTHPAMPREPLILLHTALCSKIPEKLEEINQYINPQRKSMALPFAEEDSTKIKAAVFYSISATQKGLAGIQLGHYIIKEVVQQITKEFPCIDEFSTLSPVPQFRDWVMSRLRKNVGSIFTREECEALEKALHTRDVARTLDKLFLTNKWTKDEKISGILKEPLLRACAWYLYNEKKTCYAKNRVAHFHLSNGAVLWRINWMAQESVRHVEHSFGIMVNYRYYLNECERNSDRYLENHVVNIGESVQKLLDDGSAGNSVDFPSYR